MHTRDYIRISSVKQVNTRSCEWNHQHRLLIADMSKLQRPANELQAIMQLIDRNDELLPIKSCLFVMNACSPEARNVPSNTHTLNTVYGWFPYMQSNRNQQGWRWSESCKHVTHLYLMTEEGGRWEGVLWLQWRCVNRSSSLTTC